MRIFSYRWHDDFGQAQIQEAVERAIRKQFQFFWDCVDGWQYETRAGLVCGHRNYLRRATSGNRVVIKDMYGTEVCSLLTDPLY